MACARFLLSARLLTQSLQAELRQHQRVGFLPLPSPFA